MSELTDDLSLAGDPLTKITNLRDDQYYESWIWDDLFLEWNGTNLAIVPGCAYEMTTSNDTVLTIAGRDNTGRALAAGVYFMKFRADEYTQVEKVILLR